MEIVTEKMGRAGLNNHDDDHHGPRSPKQNGDDHDEVMKEGKMTKNEKKKEKTMLRTPADIYEHPCSYSFILDIPDLDAQNIKVKVKDGILHVTGKRKKMKKMTTDGDGGEGVTKVIRVERRRARYMRKFSLPQDAAHDHVKASYKDGVLFITVSKTLSPENSTSNSFINVSSS